MVRSSGPFSALRFLSISMIIISATLAALQLVQFSRVRAYFPLGMRIAGVPVGGLDRQQAAQRLLEVFSRPVEMIYQGSIIHMDPSVVDFQIDLNSMLAAADLQRSETLFWQEYWDFLWGRVTRPRDIPLRSSFSETRLRVFLGEISERYDQQPVAPLPIAGTFNFAAGRSGSTLNMDASVVLIGTALRSTHGRTVELPLERVSPPRPSFDNLQIMLQQLVQTAGFDGVVGVYLLDLQTARELHFAYRQGENIPVQPDIAFTASSTMKLPIMVSAYRRLDENIPDDIARWMRDMITESANEPSDWITSALTDRQRGPLFVTDDLKALGLQNTFWAGYFSIGSPLLAVVNTPANQRSDINTSPDPYNQTTVSELGMLLTDLYQCAEFGGGALLAVFPEEITQAECQIMVDLLKANHLPWLLTGGLPEGTPIAHKHGWVSDINGVIRTVGDAGIIYTPSGSYVLVIFVNHPTQIIWAPVAQLISDMSRAVYQFFNLKIE
jgi:beta-lactamase class A